MSEKEQAENSKDSFIVLLLSGEPMVLEDSTEALIRLFRESSSIGMYFSK